MTKGTRRHSLQFTLTACVLATGLAAGCARIQVAVPTASEGEWRVEGGGHDRAHHASLGVDPPLDPAWTARLEALPSAAGATVAGDHLFVTTRRGDFTVMSWRSGDELGRRRLAPALAGAPLIVGELAILTAPAGEQTVIAFDLERGSIRWRADAGAIESSATIFGEKVIVASTDGRVSSLGLADGDSVWVASPDDTGGIFSSPLIVDSLVIVADDRGAVTALHASDGSVVWRASVERPVYAGTGHHDGTVFVPTTRGAVCALRASDGGMTWCHDADDPLVRMTGVSIAGSLIVFGGTDGVVRAVDGTTGEAVWIADLGAGIVAAPLTTPRSVYVGTLDGRVLALALDSGDVVWEGEVPGRVHAAAVPAPGRILILSAPRNLTAFTVAEPGAARATSSSAGR